MVILYHSPLFKYIKEYFEHCNFDDTIFLFVPYIKTKILEKLLDGVHNRVVIVTTWTPRDLQSGSSDITLYPFCRERKIALYLSDNMHLKIYSVELKSAILATGNISSKGLQPDGNYEAAIKLNHLNAEDRLFFGKIRRNARLVNDIMYEEIKKWTECNKIDILNEIPLKDIISFTQKDNFSIASLPMTRSVDDLISGYGKMITGKEPSDNPEITACIFHDLINYDIASDLSESAFVNDLTVKFFVHPFIQKIDEFISPEAYFGRIKEWIQNNCTDVPVPSRRELTGNVQVLLEWFEKLGNGKYKIDILGRASQRIYKID